MFRPDGTQGLVTGGLGPGEPLGLGHVLETSPWEEESCSPGPGVQAGGDGSLLKVLRVAAGRRMQRRETREVEWPALLTQPMCV